jgi:pilus assembly protein Flp/PilA
VPLAIVTTLQAARSVMVGGWAVKNLVTRFLKDESGATAIEYGLIAAGVAVTIIGALKSLGKDLTATFKTIRKAL